MVIYVATANKHKIAEISAILAPLGIRAEAHPLYASLNVEETGSTFEENAALKAEALSRLANGFAIADDSGIAVDALDGAPGVYSARYAGEGAPDGENNALLLRNMTGVDDRGAKFVCVIALAENGRVVRLFRGENPGTVAREMKGGGGFGYDPLFVLDDGRTMAELTPEEKNGISHRGRALRLLADYLQKGI